MGAQHTPGPWEWDAGIIPPDGPGRYADIYVIGEDREPVTIAEFNDNIPEGRANARLIAEAPSLLTLARQYRNDLLYPLADDSRQRRIEAIDAVLSKIDGAA